MKVAPGQQLILANEYGPRSGSTTILEQALGLSVAGAVVKHIAVLVAVSSCAQFLARSRGVFTSAHDPTQQYARTQASFGDASKGMHIDVLA